MLIKLYMGIKRDSQKNGDRACQLEQQAQYPK
jgi:hypothetical protein